MNKVKEMWTVCFSNGCLSALLANIKKHSEYFLLTKESFSLEKLIKTFSFFTTGENAKILG